MSDWQSIETAPKNGTWLLGYEPCENTKYTGHVIMRWREESSWREAGWFSDYGRGNTIAQPSHWMPLPDEPGAAQS